MTVRRRSFLKTAVAAGAGSAVFARALAALSGKGGAVTPEMIRDAEWIAGVTLTDEERALAAKGVGQSHAAFEACRAVPLDNAVAPAFRFDPEPPSGGRVPSRGAGTAGWVPVAGGERPASEVDLAFAGVAALSGLLERRQVSAVELTRLYLDRIERHDPVLRAVITRTDALALRAAEAADRAIAAGRRRGPLHGIPWGAKDLLAVPGYRTTWGSVPYREQVRPEAATVFERLEAAGAVLVAKTAVGELAWGDVWFDGTTKNPWKTDQGSSGSSAGSASGTSAGLFAFAIGTETWGSIVSPCTRCGVSGLRPSFGRVSRHGAMALSWTMDKIGPIARSVDDLALVFSAIHGADGRDPSAISRPFDWPHPGDPKKLRVGFVPNLFDFDYTKWADEDEDPKGYAEWQANDRKVLEDLRALGFSLVPVALPADLPVAALSTILTAEAAAAFDDLTRTGKDDLLVRQVEQAWPNIFRQGQLIPAVEYLRANRIRTLLIRAMDEAMRGVDVLAVPTYGGDNLLATNLTGHPAVCVPNGFRESDGTPTSITFQGRLHEEDRVLAVARLYQEATGFHRRRPPQFA
jgi:Asp-tRNA(Asn)/Glu-tRNA(Gln) amidotransferase A subunit family amidase